MSSKLYRFIAPVAVGATVAAGAGVLGAATASAETTTTPFNNACLATPSSSLAGGPQTQVQAASVTVDAPTTVAPGEEFVVTISPPPISVPNDLGSGASLANISRLKIDVAMPENAQFLGAEVVAGTSAGITGVAPNVLVVNEQGNVDPNGQIIRLSGNNQTIGNGPNSSKNSEGGIKANASGSTTSFQLPQVKARLKAGATGDISMKLRTAGNAGQFGNDANFLTFLPRANAPIIGTVWAPTQCSPRDTSGGPLNSGAGPLATIQIQRQAVATVTYLDGPSAVTNGGEFTLNATVAPTPDSGQVQFTRDGENVGAPVDLVNGKASLTETLGTDGDYSYEAKFLGAEFYNQSSGSKTVTVTSQDIQTTTSVTGPDHDAYREQPVNLTAKVEPGVSGGTVTFEVDGTAAGTAAVMDDGAAVLPHTFTTNGTHRVIARYSGTAGVSPSVSLQYPVSVTEAPAADVATTITVDPVASTAKGSPVTLTARLAPADARGTVQFKLGDVLLGGPVRVDANGVATLTTFFQNPGEFVVTAEFTADAGFIDSAANPVNVTVTGDPDTIPGPDSGSLGSLSGLFGSLGG
ncbi:Ig-like domain repeat protein [Prescottella agglutinans]|uniref:Ig-like domain repeat protein n=1 Tax=Prescottella agglutinans TaxID=1644129 RepID=A0A438B9V5_9NOCA|nr:Ig-like domain-containing protein [Prescottella agglutinans]RVW07769.1 Ig-like domain repeat protein [Prescottella agglutinans]